MSISDEVRQCKLCPLSATLDLGFNPQPGTGSRTSKILVVYDTITRDDYLTQNYLTGKEGLFFDRVLSQVGLTRQDMYISPLLKCFSSEKTKLFPCYKICGTWLDKQITALKPKIIITFGNFSAKHFKLTFNHETVKDDMFIASLPSLFRLMNLGKNMVDYHTERLRKAIKWDSSNQIHTEKAEKNLS